MKIGIYDIDDPENLDDLEKQDYIGSFEFTLAKAVSRKELIGDIELEKSEGESKITILASEKKSDFGKT